MKRNRIKGLDALSVCVCVCVVAVDEAHGPVFWCVCVCVFFEGGFVEEDNGELEVCEHTRALART